MLRSGAALIVTEAFPSRHGRSLAKDLNIETIPITRLAKADLASDPSLIFDLDLGQAPIVHQLKALLATKGEGCRIFLVDPNLPTSVARARALGADVLLPTGGTARDIQAALRQHFGLSGHGDDPVTQSVTDGVKALDMTFLALSEGTALDTDGVLDAGGRISDAIRGGGAEEWLATVRGYHMGTFQHCMLVTGVAAGFGIRTGMARSDVVMLTTTGLLHDIGKASIPLELLDKPGALTDAEAKIVRTHPVIGADYLDAHSAVDESIRRSVRHHHEYLDGTGYPDGLSGGQIDDLTRILTICDIYAALVERRSYKPAKSPAQAMVILEAMASTGKVETSLVRALGKIMAPG